jgi:hypothetical protein
VEIVTGETVDLPANLKRRFYPPLLLLDYLVQTKQYARRRADDPSLDQTSTPEEIFDRFVCRVASLCHTEPCGDAVSACAVLKRADTGNVLYLFAFNSRDAKQLDAIRLGITSILKMLCPPLPPSSGHREALHRRILREALSFNTERIRNYLKHFQEQLGECIAACRRENTDDCLSIYR